LEIHLDALQAFLDQGWVGSVIGGIGAIVGAVGIVAAIWTYRASRVGARPVYQTSSLRLFGIPHSVLAKDVEVRFRGQRVERLTKTSLLLWNSGNEILQGSSIVASDPLRFEFPANSMIIDADIVKVTRSANNCTVRIDDENRNRLLERRTFI
jgi:hypothetical protein